MVNMGAMLLGTGSTPESVPAVKRQIGLLLVRIVRRHLTHCRVALMEDRGKSSACSA